MKVYHDRNQLDRNIKTLTILSKCNIPVAEIILTQNGKPYAAHQDSYFLLSKKLPGNNVSDLRDQNAAHQMGRAIAQLHTAFLKCEAEIAFWDNSLLAEIKGWVREALEKNEWQPVPESAYTQTVSVLETVYDDLPKQLIHRDVHFGNFLFSEGRFTGYIDFDLSQKNIRIFDICYFLAGLLAEETEAPLTKSEWIETVQSVATGYESLIQLSEKEIEAIPCVMECIEILCAAYFTGIQDIKHADDAYRIFCFIQDCESSVKQSF